MIPFIDISRHQGPVDFTRMTANHVEGVFIRAGNGTRPDPMFLPYLSGARAAGLKVGVYWFCNPKVSTGIDQAQRLTAAHLVARGDLRPMLDVEDYTNEAGPTGQLPPAQYAVWLRAMAAEVAKVRTPIIYTNRAYWGAHVQATDFGHLDLICARYPFYSPAECAVHVPPLDARDWDEWIMAETPKRPQVPDGWDTWNAWQFSAGYNGRGHAYGASSSDLDLNIARDDAWQRWLDHAPVDPPEIIDPPTEDDMPAITPPQRLCDTREPGRHPLQGGEQFSLDGIMAKQATVNLTVVSPTADGYLVAWGKGGKPHTSNVQFTAGHNADNAAVVELDAGTLHVEARSSSGKPLNCHLIVDLQAAC